MAERNPSRFKYAARGGNSGAVKDGVVYGGSSACIRKAQARHHGVNESADDTLDFRKKFVFSVGNSIEPIIAERERALTGKQIDEDALLEWVSKDDPESGFTGHMDLIFVDENGKRHTPIEHKTIQSLSRCKETMVNNGKWKEAYLYQLGKYMLYSRSKEGILMFTMIFNSNPFKKYGESYNFRSLDSKNFYVNIREDGGLLVGESKEELEYIGIDVKDLHEHTLLTLKWLKKDEVYPFRPELKFSDAPACMFCPFQSTCDKVEQGQISTIKEFLTDIKESQTENDIQKQGITVTPITIK